ncbi:MAG: phosphotransferase [Acidimicrobiales bacterium]
MSAAAVVDVTARGGRCRSVFMKRQHRAVRSTGDLAVEHALAVTLRAGGVPVPPILTNDDGTTVVVEGRWRYEVHGVAAGIDLYRDVPSWHPYACPAHAEAAGRALARFHRAAAKFAAPARPPGPLVVSTAVVAAPDPLAALDRFLTARPALAAAVDRQTVRRDFTRWHLPAIERLAPLLAACGSQWGHGDWHPSNLTWTAAGTTGEVAAVLDLGLANRTAAVHDLAVAVERAVVDWLAVGGTGVVRADFAALDALLAGYCDERRLVDAERAAMPDAVRVAHVEYALSEVEYFAAVVGAPDYARLAYDNYFVGHGEWFATAAGDELLVRLCRAMDR